MKRITILKDVRFRKLTVLEDEVHVKGLIRVPIKVKCDCGQIFETIKSYLLRNYSNLCPNILCKRQNIKDIAGQRFGRLLALRLLRTSRKGAVWLFRCDCGNEVENLQVNITRTRKPTQSCGCLSLEESKRRRLLGDLAAFNTLLDYYKSSARKRNHEFNLTEIEFRELTKSNCFYCGIEPKQIVKRKDYSVYIYNGIDRKDNTKGYTLDNSLSCCGTCNYSKSSQTFEDFNDWLDRLTKFRIEKKNEQEPNPSDRLL